jgi:hypothetical protein
MLRRARRALNRQPPRWLARLAVGAARSLAKVGADGTVRRVATAQLDAKLMPRLCPTHRIASAEFLRAAGGQSHPSFQVDSLQRKLD